MADLLVAPCSFDAARYAILNWHYSRTMPAGKLARYGVWEGERFIGAVLFGRGGSVPLGTSLRKQFDVEITEWAELVRVALTDHEHPVSQIVAETIAKLKQTNPGLRLLISFADPHQGHVGGIYQAMNWIYAGESTADMQIWFQGRWCHVRTANHVYRRSRATLPTRWVPGKHRYFYPLDRAMRRRVGKIALPYPHAVEGSEVSRSASGGEGQVRSLPTALIVSR